VGGEFREGFRLERLEIVDDGVVVRGRLHGGAGHGIEVGDEGGRFGLEAELPPGPQSQEEDRDGGPDEILFGIEHVLCFALVREHPDDLRQVGHEMAERLGEDGA